MGWHSWNVFEEEVSEKLVKQIADAMASSGMTGGVTGSYDFEEQDATTFAAWGIDYLKYHDCNAPGDMVSAFARYKKMGNALHKTSRPIVYSICEW